MNTESRLAFVATSGLLVFSLNVTVKTSPFPNMASSPSGSATVSEVIDGPALVPKFPESNGDNALDGSDVFAASLRFPADFAVIYNPPTIGGAAPN